MTVADIMLNFRAALLSVLPSVIKVGIPWRRPDAYDEWDAVASALFNALVLEVLRYATPNLPRDQFRLPAYDLLMSNYAELCVVRVRHPALREGRFVFHAFGTSDKPFDTIELRMVSDEGIPFEQDLMFCPVGGATFTLQLSQFRNNVEVDEVPVG